MIFLRRRLKAEIRQFAEQSRLEEFRIALELTFSYFEKHPEILPEILYLLLEKFCFQFHSYDYRYTVQKTIVDFLPERVGGVLNPAFYKRVLIKVADKYLKTHFHSGWMETKATYSYVNFGLGPLSKIFEIRNKILQFLTSEFAKGVFSDSILQIIVDYSDNIYEKNSEENTNAIAAEDAKTILPFLTETMNPDNYVHCVVAQKYLHFLEKRKVSFDKALKTRFVNETYRISKVLNPDRFMLYGLRGNDRDKYNCKDSS